MYQGLELEVNTILDKVEKLSNSHIYFRDDLEILIKAAQKNKNFSLLEKLSFNAKFSNGLLRVIQRKDKMIDETYFNKASSEFRDSLQKVIILLENILMGEKDFIKTIFKEKYLELNQQCLNNLNNLCSDLSYLKLYFNDLTDNTVTKNEKGLED